LLFKTLCGLGTREKDDRIITTQDIKVTDFATCLQNFGSMDKYGTLSVSLEARLPLEDKDRALLMNFLREYITSNLLRLLKYNQGMLWNSQIK
jgi:hypothetical protein